MFLEIILITALSPQRVPEREIAPEREPSAAEPGAQPSLFAKIEEAKRLLRAAKLPSRRIGGQDALLAVHRTDDPAGAIALVPVRNGESRTPKFGVKLAKRNGVNTEYEVIRPDGYEVLAIKTNVRDPKRHSRAVVYVPSSAAEAVPEAPESGLAYLTALAERAAAELEKREVYSMALDDALVTETVPQRVIVTIMVIEHITPADVENEGIEAVVSRVLATVGVNKENSYDYAVSRARARGLAQFIPSTYRLTRQRYVAARLAKDFRAGMADHLNAALAMFCLADWSLTALPDFASLITLGPEGEEELGAFIAAAYNGGEKRAAAAYGGDRENWERAEGGLAKETVTYVKTFRAVYQTLFGSAAPDESE